MLRQWSWVTACGPPSRPSTAREVPQQRGPGLLPMEDIMDKDIDISSVKDDAAPALSAAELASALRHLAGCVADCETLAPTERTAISNQMRSIRDTLLALDLRAWRPSEGRSPKDDVAEAGSPSPAPWARASGPAASNAGAPRAVDDARATASPKDRPAAAPSDLSPTPASKPWCFGLHVIGANQRKELLELLAALDERLHSEERDGPLGVKLAAARAALGASR